MYTTPSKKFIVRGTMTIAVVALVLIVQTNWFKSLFHKKEVASTVLDPNTTVGDLVTKDSNGNGIPDWEERLWGLNPNVLYTNGVSNKQIIDERRRSLGGTDSETQPTDATDRLARELFTITSALGDNDQIDDATLRSIAAKYADSIDASKITNRYSLKDIRTVPTTTLSLKTYYKTVQAIMASYNKSATTGGTIDVVITALESGDTSSLPELATTATEYRTLAKKLVAVATPVGVAEYQLAITNGLAGVADSFTLLQELDDNAGSALVGIAVYKNYSTKLTHALTDLQDYLDKYGILN